MTLDELMPLFEEYQYRRRELESFICETSNPHADPRPRERAEKKLRKEVAEAGAAFEAGLIEYLVGLNFSRMRKT